MILVELPRTCGFDLVRTCAYVDRRGPDPGVFITYALPY